MPPPCAQTRTSCPFLGVAAVRSFAVMPRAPITAPAPPTLEGLSDRDRKRLRLLALRYRVRRDTTLRPVADVMFDLRLRHGVQLTMGQIFELLGERVTP